MFQKTDCYRLGTIARLHSFKGEVAIFLDVDDPFEYKNLESVLVEYDTKLIPFFLEQISIRPNGQAVVKFLDTDTERQAKKLLKCGLYLPLSDLPELEGNEFYYHEIEGFSVIDQVHGAIGTVNQVMDLPNNPLISVQFNDQEILIPRKDEFILEVNRDKQEIHIVAPEGLIEMYLGTDEEE
jgi:16S rRNA processing protein RimM